MFETISAAPADPILGLNDAFKSDNRDQKINLGVGIFKDSLGKTPVLKAVKLAEQRLVDDESTKNYLAISGVAEYAQHVQKLLYGNLFDSMEERIVTTQTPGGTGGLRMAAEFLVRQAQCKRIWISKPSWPNHASVFKAAGLEVLEYRYYDSVAKNIDFAALTQDLEQVEAGDAVLLHGCCHNPTGIDPDMGQWKQIASILKNNNALPFFDFAYQGFGNGIEEDAMGLRHFAQEFDELLVASSFSKNFGLYNERVGALTLQAKEPEAAQNSFSQLKGIIRSIYSNPPAHGAMVVSTILADPELRSLWESELQEMRDRIKEMRSSFVETLEKQGVIQDFSFIAKQNGMFSFSGLEPHQVAQLREEHAIYIVGSGRINVAGITPGNIETLCKAIASVL